MNKNIVLLGVLLVVGIGVYAWRNQSITARQDTQKQLIVYSGRKEALIMPIIDSFQKDTGINVTVKSGSTEELANLLIKENEQTQADVYIGTDASLLEMLNNAHLLTKISSEKLTQVPGEYRSKDDTWTGVSGRARVLIVNTDLVSEENYPTSIYDVTDESWAGRVAMAKITNESVITHLSAMKKLHNKEFLINFLKGLQSNNVTILAGHTDVRQAVARGEFAVGFVNHYYGHLQQQESDNIAIVYPDQSEGEDGAFVNISGVGITKHGDNNEAAQMFVDYLLSDKAQQQFAELNFEFPLIEGFTSANTKNLGEFKKMNVSLHDVAGIRQETVEDIKSIGL